MTPLEVACSNGHVEAAQVMMEFQPLFCPKAGRNVKAQRTTFEFGGLSLTSTLFFTVTVGRMRTRCPVSTKVPLSQL